MADYIALTKAARCAAPSAILRLAQRRHGVSGQHGVLERPLSGSRRPRRGRSKIGNHAAGKQGQHPGDEGDRGEGHNSFRQVLAARRGAEASMQHG